MHNGRSRLLKCSCSKSAILPGFIRLTSYPENTEMFAYLSWYQSSSASASYLLLSRGTSPGGPGVEITYILFPCLGIQRRRLQLRIALWRGR